VLQLAGNELPRLAPLVRLAVQAFEGGISFDLADDSLFTILVVDDELSQLPDVFFSAVLKEGQIVVGLYVMPIFPSSVCVLALLRLLLDRPKEHFQRYSAMPSFVSSCCWSSRSHPSVGGSQ